jgi:O-acetylserine/cysteine efflux transporter
MPAAQAAPLVIVLLLVDSLHFVFARLLRPYLPGGTSAFYVLAIAAVEVGVFLGLRGRIRPAVFRRQAPFFLVIGFLVAASTAINYIAVSYLDPGTASLLAQTSILFALGFSVFWLREHLSRPEKIGALLALAGVFTVTFQPGNYLRTGSLLVLSSAFLYALHAAVVKRHGEEIDFANFFFFRVAATAAFLLSFAVARGQLEPPPAAAWPFLLLAATVDVVISRVLYYLALRRFRLSFHTILLTLSPVVTILWSLALFRERPAAQGLIGGLLVLGGVAVVTASRRRQAGSAA